MLELHLTRDLDRFASLTAGFLEGRVEHNQLATVLIRARRGFHSEAPPLFAYGRDGDGEVRFAALRTPPWRMLTSTAVDLDAGRLMELWLAEDPEVPGVIGERGVAGSLAGAWARATGGRSSISMMSAFHVLEDLRGPARPAAGSLRSPADGEDALLIEWEAAFLADVGIEVNIPPERLVAARLTAGAQFVFTDLEDPTSNRIYAALGFVPVADWVEIAFEG